MKKILPFVRPLCGLFFTFGLLCPSFPSFAAENFSKSLKLNAKQAEMAGLLATYYREKGWPEQAVVGIVANLFFECSLDPAQVNTNGASGLAQWLGIRKKNFVKKYGKLPHQAPWQQQAAFIEQALTDPTSPYKFVGRELLNSKNSKEAILYFARDYEVPGRSRKEATAVALNRAKKAFEWEKMLKHLGKYPEERKQK